MGGLQNLDEHMSGTPNWTSIKELGVLDTDLESGGPIEMLSADLDKKKGNRRKNQVSFSLPKAASSQSINKQEVHNNQLYFQRCIYK